MEKNIVLLVEDNPDDVKMALRALRKSSVRTEVIVAEDGSVALDYLFGTGKYAGRDVRVKPKLILLDLKMPRLSGLEVLERIRADLRTHLLPVVMLTTSTEEKDRINCYHARCNSYIRKPVDFDEFTNVVQQLGAYWMALNELP